MIVLAEPPTAPEYGAAIAVAAPLFVVGVLLALIVTRFSAWYARRWRAPRDE